MDIAGVEAEAVRAALWVEVDLMESEDEEDVVPSLHQASTSRVVAVALGK